MVTLAALLALSPPALSPVQQNQIGQAVLKRCQAAYDLVKTLDVHVKAHLEDHKATAHVQFSRPGKLRVSGDNMFGSKYDLLCDGKKTWLRMDSWSEQPSPEIGIAAITGISGNAGTLVPAMLMHAEFIKMTQPKGAISVSQGQIGGHRAIIVSTQQPLKMTYWIDASTYFLMKTTMDAMGHQIVVEFDPPTVNKPILNQVFKK